MNNLFLTIIILKILNQHNSKHQNQLINLFLTIINKKILIHQNKKHKTLLTQVNHI